MTEPKIDSSWSDDDNMVYRPFLVVGVPALLLVIALVLSCFKGCTSLGRQGGLDVYDPGISTDDGFVGHANSLLANLLSDTAKADIKAVDLESLNRKYPALVFALPENERHREITYASDLRLVGIRAERIKSEEDRMFYYNSRLPQLLQRQGLQMADGFFKISFGNEDYDETLEATPIHIRSIEVVSSLFKVALAKDPWIGVIEGARNCLFEDGKAVYVAFGSSVLPIPTRCSDVSRPLNYLADVNHGCFTYEDGTDVDYYVHYKNMFDPGNCNRRQALQITVQDKDRSLVQFEVACRGDNTLFVKTSQLQNGSRFRVRVFSSDSVEVINAGWGSVKVKDGLKLVLYNSVDDHKLGEFTIYTKDPTRTLSHLIQTNVGQQRYSVSHGMTDLFTQQVIRGLSRNMTNTYNIDTVELSLDPMLSMEFEKELKTYLNTLKRNIHYPENQTNNVYDISMTVMDISTGDIIASPFYTDMFDDNMDSMQIMMRNPALSRRYLGSTFKPMVALAAVQTNPSLLDLVTTGGKYSADFNAMTGEFFQRTVTPWAKGSNNWGGTDFVNFIAHSDDVYPVALAAYALTGQNITDGFTRLPVDGNDNFLTMSRNGGRLSLVRPNNNSILSHPFIGWMEYLYGANYDTDYSTDTILFQNLYKRQNVNMSNHRFGLDEVSPEVTNLNVDRFNEGLLINQILAPWVLGQGDNQWSCFKIAEGWCRMLGTRDVKMSLLHSDGEPATLLDDYRYPKSVKNNDVQETWRRFLNVFYDAQKPDKVGSTLKDMYNCVEDLNNSVRPDDGLKLFSKTGTPNSYLHNDEFLLGGSNRHLDIGMYTFGLISKSQFDGIWNKRCPHGIVCVIRITRSYECRDCNWHALHDRGNAPHRGQCRRCFNASKGKRNSLWSSHAQEFFTSNRARLRKFYDMTRRYY